jgi:hypothetical protein
VGVDAKAECRKPNIHYSQKMNNCTDIKSPKKSEIRHASQKSEAVKNGMYYIIRLELDRKTRSFCIFFSVVT